MKIKNPALSKQGFNMHNQIRKLFFHYFLNPDVTPCYFHGAGNFSRVYLQTNKPIFVGRDAVVKYNLAHIENERRVGYSWYNNRAATLIAVEYPAWKKKWQIK